MKLGGLSFKLKSAAISSAEATRGRKTTRVRYPFKFLVRVELELYVFGRPSKKRFPRAGFTLEQFELD